MLENTMYNLGRKYIFYATVPTGQKSMGGLYLQSGKKYHTKD